LSFGNK